MKNYKVKTNLKHNGEDYMPDSEIELDADIAQPLVRDGVIIDPEDKGEEATEKVESRVQDANKKNEEEEKKDEIGEDESGEESGDESKEENEEDKDKEYKEMNEDELIPILKGREIDFNGKTKEEMIELLERSDRVRNENEPAKDGAESGNDL